MITFHRQKVSDLRLNQAQDLIWRINLFCISFSIKESCNYVKMVDYDIPGNTTYAYLKLLID